MTAAIIPSLQPATALPGQGLTAATTLNPGNGQAGAAVDCGLAFAQLVNALIGGKPQISKEVLTREGSCLESEEPEADQSEQSGAGPTHQDLMPLAAIPLPVPVPPTMPKTGICIDLGPELELRQAEPEVIHQSAAVPIAVGSEAAVTGSCPRPSMVEAALPESAGQEQLRADQSVPEPEQTMELQIPLVAPDKAPAGAETEIGRLPADPAALSVAASPLSFGEAAPRRQHSTQSLAFSLRLTGYDKGAVTESKSSLDAVPASEDNKAAASAGVGKDYPAEVTSSPSAPATAKTRIVAALSRPTVDNVAAAFAQVRSRDENNQARNAASGEANIAPASRQVKVRAITEAGSEKQESQKVPIEVHPSGASIGALFSKPELSTNPRPTESSANQPSARAEIIEPVNTNPLNTVPPRAAREIVIQIANETSRKVEVQVAEKAGEVHIAVRTADAELNQTLRVELGSLVSRLETAGYRAESLAPSESFVSSSSSARQDPSNSQQDASRGFSGQGQGSSGQGSNGQRRQQSEGAPWAEQFVSNLAPEHETGQENIPWQSISRQ